jgi:hypothetical protein
MSVQPVIHFGYRFRWSTELDEDVIGDALALNDILPEPLFVACLRPYVDDLIIESPSDVLVLGVAVDQGVDLDDLYAHRKTLEEFVSGHPFLEGFRFESHPRFYCGLPWVPSDEESESESESESVSESISVDEVSDVSDVDSPLEEVSDLPEDLSQDES